MANGNKSKGDDAAGGDGRSGDFSTAALALMNSVSLNVRFTHGTADTLQASWVAENQLAEAQLTKPTSRMLNSRGRKSWAGAAGTGVSSG